jgi:hypothetical protein
LLVAAAFQALAMQKLVFFSYSRDQSVYIDAFAPLLRAASGDPNVYFYQDAPLLTGVMSEELQEKISEAQVFICFLSADYASSPACKSEFEMASALQQTAGGVRATARWFTPVVLDSQGIAFWQENVKPGKPAAWASDLLYANFIDPDNGMRPSAIVVKGRTNQPVANKIQELGRRIKKRMNW